MRAMKSEDYVKVEESLQQQFQSADSHNWKVGGYHSIGNTSLGSLTQQSTGSEEEFFSMTEFPLPALGQPTLLNAVKQQNDIIRASPTSPRSTLSNISLGGSSSSLSNKGIF